LLVIGEERRDDDPSAMRREIASLRSQ